MLAGKGKIVVVNGKQKNVVRQFHRVKRKRVSHAHRALLLVKLVLLALVVWKAATIILRKDSEQKPTIESRIIAPKAEIVLVKEPLPPADYNGILERDLFRSQQADEINKELKKGSRTASSEPVTEKLRLLGTVAGSEKFARAVIVDLKTKEQNCYATGEFIHGARIEKIERDRIILLNEDGQEMLNFYVASGDSVSDESEVTVAAANNPNVSDVVKVISPTEREINKKAFLAKVGRMDAVLRAVKFSPHVVNEKEEGLRITNLEGLNIASYIGLRNGDVVQDLNGQTITNRRKAFQVLRRAQTLPSSDIEFLRGAEKKTLSLKMR